MLSRSSLRALRNTHRRCASLTQTANYSSLQGKVIAISGAASGMGLATAKHLYPMGVRLSLTDIHKDALDAAIPQITSSSHPTDNLFHTVTDVRSPSQVNSWIQSTVSHFGALDGAANIAGVVHKNVGLSPITQLTDQEWHFVHDVNLHGMFYALRAQLGAMEKLGTGGSIVNIASTSGLEGNAMNANYSAAKHGVVGLTRSAAKEVGKGGIRVNAVAPGPVETPMMKVIPPPMMEYLERLLEQNQALGRRGQPVEIAKLIAFLLSGESSFTSGATYVADGGQLC